MTTNNPANPWDAPRFELAGASFAIEGRTLLAPLTLSLSPGRVTGLIGHNGSGKSTLLKLPARCCSTSRPRR